MGHGPTRQEGHGVQTSAKRNAAEARTRRGGKTDTRQDRTQWTRRKRELPLSLPSPSGSWLRRYSLIAALLLSFREARGLPSAAAFASTHGVTLPTSLPGARASFAFRLRGPQRLSSLASGSSAAGRSSWPDVRDDVILRAGDASALVQKRCANTVQGRVLVTDDRGFTCRRWELLPASGCCPGEALPEPGGVSSRMEGEASIAAGAAFRRRTSSKSLLAFPNPLGEVVLEGGEGQGGVGREWGTAASSEAAVVDSEEEEEDEGGRFSCLTCNVTKGCCTSYERCVSCCLSPKRTPATLALSTPRAQQPSAAPFASVFEYCTTRCRHNSKSVVHENAYISELHHCFRMPSPTQNPPQGQDVFAARDPPGQEVKPAVAARGVSCDDACAKVNMKCDVRYMGRVNDCTVLRQHLGCRAGCIRSAGPDQPSEVADSAPASQKPGVCLVNSEPDLFSCSGSHDYTRRLCPCRHWLAV